MKHLVSITLASVLLVGYPILAVAQTSDRPDSSAILKAFSTPVVVDGNPVWATVLTDASVDALWHGTPAADNLRTVAAGGHTVIYVMGVAVKRFTFPVRYTIEQDGHSFSGTGTNVSHFDGVAIPEGETILGLVEFDGKVALDRPFTLTLGGGSATVAIDSAAVSRWGQIAPPKDVFASHSKK